MRAPSPLAIDDLFRFLPELEDVRRALAVASVVDPDKGWESSSRFTTLDKRLVSHAAAADALAAAEQSLHARVTEVFGRVRQAVDALYSGDVAGAVYRLIEVGEAYEAIESHEQARECFERAVDASAPLPHRGPHILGLRRLGRSLLAQGDFAAALRAYARSAQVASDAGDMEGEIIARTAEGNVLLRQGRTTDAERVYGAALDRVAAAPDPAAFAVQAGQLRTNLARVTLRQGRFDEAERWLEESREVWRRIESPQDLMICDSVEGELRAEQGRLEESAAVYERGFDLGTSPTPRAIFAIDLAEIQTRRGRVDEGFRWARVAEEQALAARSPDYLAHVYRGLGNVARDAGEMDGITFYEKALDIARERGLPYEEAETLVQYARLRERMGGAEEAASFLERAAAIYRELGAEQRLREAEELLARLPAVPGGGVEPVAV